MRKRVTATGKSAGEAERKARKDLDKQAVSKGKRVARPKTNSKLVSTKHGAFYLGKSSGCLKKPK
jgi:hypothetical protein